MTEEDLKYAMCTCDCLYYNGETYYEESKLIECLKDLGLLKETSDNKKNRNQINFNEVH